MFYPTTHCIDVVAVIFDIGIENKSVGMQPRYLSISIEIVACFFSKATWELISVCPTLQIYYAKRITVSSTNGIYHRSVHDLSRGFAVAAVVDVCTALAKRPVIR